MQSPRVHRDRWSHQKAHAVIIGLLHLMHKDIHVMANEVARLTESVAVLKSRDASLITLVKGLAKLIRDNVDNGPALAAIADDIDAQSAQIAEAIDENDDDLPPAEPPVEPTT